MDRQGAGESVRRESRDLAGIAVLAVVAVGFTLAVLFGPDGSLSLIDGPFVAAFVALAVIGVTIGVAGRSRRWWSTWGTGIGAAAALIVLGLYWWLRDTGLVDQHYPPTFLLWVWGALVAVGVAATGWWSGRAALRLARFLTAAVALFASFLLINAHYGYWPTMGALLDRPVPGQVSSQVLRHTLVSHAASPVGQFGPVTIPGPPGFDAGAAWAWIPPAYNQVDHADLPVLVLLPGVPGRPDDWEQAGTVVDLANGWARTHGGVAPVMLLVTGNGAHDRDTECVNGTQGNAETYLTQSVPDFITHQLGITPDPARWGIVGFSEGGTCALGMVTEHPQIYGRFVDLAGDLAPNFGTNTLVDLYAGDRTAQLHHEPRWLMARHAYPHTEGWFASSAQDRSHEVIARQLYDAARAAHMKVFDVSGGPDGHSWTYARIAFRSIYPALVTSMPSPAGTLVYHHRALVAEPGHATDGHRRT